MPAVPSVKINHIFETEFVRGKTVSIFPKKERIKAPTRQK